MGTAAAKQMDGREEREQRRGHHRVWSLPSVKRHRRMCGHTVRQPRFHLRGPQAARSHAEQKSESFTAGQGLRATVVINLPAYCAPAAPRTGRCRPSGPPRERVAPAAGGSVGASARSSGTCIGARTATVERTRRGPQVRTLSPRQAPTTEAKARGSLLRPAMRAGAPAQGAC